MFKGHEFLVNATITASVLDAHGVGQNGTLVIVAVHAAVIGGIVSIIARIQNFVARDNLSPTVLHISVLRKPFLASVFVVLVLCVIKIGLVSIPGIKFTPNDGPYLAWSIGFLCGFSERFAKDVIDSAYTPIFRLSGSSGNSSL